MTLSSCSFMVVEVGVEGDLLQESRSGSTISGCSSGLSGSMDGCGIFSVSSMYSRMLVLSSPTFSMPGDPFLPQRLQHRSCSRSPPAARRTAPPGCRRPPVLPGARSSAANSISWWLRFGQAAGNSSAWAQHLKQRQAQHVGDLLRLIDGGVADAALGLVDDAAQANGVGGVVDDAQIGDDVLDLLAVDRSAGRRSCR